MMKNLKVKNYVYMIVLISAIAWLVFALSLNLELSNVVVFLKLIPNVVAVDMCIIFLFIKFGWKLCIFRTWLVPFPNLNGTWIGYIYSDWIDPSTKERVKKIPVMLSIYQTFYETNCIMHTGEMKSYSTAEGFNINREQQTRQLSYIYTSKPRVLLSERSTQHDGAMVFDIVGEKEIKLKGKYWTERKTKGEIVLEFYSKKRFDEMPELTEDHPVTEQENQVQ